MRLWLFLIVRQIKKGQWFSLLLLSWPVAGFVLGLPLLMWVPYLVLAPALLWLGALMDKSFYERQMPALWPHLPADDATLDRIITNYEMRQMNDDMGEPYWLVDQEGR